MAEPEPEVETLAILRDITAAEGVEIDDRLERRTPRASDHSRKFRPGERSRHDEREVSSHGRQWRQGVMSGHEHGGVDQDGEGQLSRRTGRPDLQLVPLRAVDLADSTEGLSTQDQQRGPAGCEPRARIGPRFELFFEVKSGQDRLDNSLQPEEVAIADQAQASWSFVGERLTGLRQVDIGDLEVVDLEIAVGLVMSLDRKQARDQALSKGVGSLADRVLDADRRLGRRGFHGRQSP